MCVVCLVKAGMQRHIIIMHIDIFYSLNASIKRNSKTSIKRNANTSRVHVSLCWLYPARRIDMRKEQRPQGLANRKATVDN